MSLYWPLISFICIFLLILFKQKKALLYIIPSLVLVDIWKLVLPASFTLTVIKIFGTIGTGLFLYDRFKKKSEMSPNGLFINGLFLLIAAEFVYFSILSPWPDTTGIRPVYNLSLLKGLRQCATFATEFGFAYFVHINLKNDEDLRDFFKGLLIGVVLVITGVILEYFTRFDFYYYLTNAQGSVDINRMRGFNYEPRALAQVLCFGLAFVSFITLKNWVKILFAILFAFTIPLTFSVSGLVMMITVTPFILFYAWRKRQWFNLIYLATYFSLFALISINLNINGRSIEGQLIERRYLYQQKVEVTKSQILKQEHTAPLETVTQFPSSSPPAKFNLSSFANRFEVFEGAAINFFLNNPRYLFFGVGPGSTGLATSPYILVRDREIWKNGSDNSPTMGAVYLITQYGIIGALLFVCLWLRSGLNFLKKDQLKMLFIFFTMIFLWLLQARYFQPLIWLFILFSENNTLKQDAEI